MRFARLSEVAEINPRLRRRPADDEIVSFLGMADLDAEVGVTKGGATKAFGTVSTGYTNFEDGDLLLAKITPCFENGKIGQAQLTRPLGVGSTEFHVIRPDSSKMDSRFVLHLLRTRRIRLDGTSRMIGSAGQRRVPQSYIADLEIPVPRLAEQRRIADILDRADTLRAKRRETLAALDDLTQSIFIDMFGPPKQRSENWPVAALGSLSTLITKGTTPTSVGLGFADEGIRFLRVQDLLGEVGAPSGSALYIDERAHRSLSRSIVRPGDVLVSIAGTIGRSAVVPLTAPEMNCNQAVAIVRLRPDVDRSYVKGWLASSDAIKQIGSSTVTATISNLSLSQIGALQVPTPPYALQRRYAARVVELEIVESSYKRSTGELDALFASLQDRAFRGDL